MVEALTIFVEGGGDHAQLRARCRQGFSEFIKKSGLKNQMPSIWACGSRAQALDLFKTALKKGQRALLLVDSEFPVAERNKNLPWKHLEENETDYHWKAHAMATDNDCHLMVQCMESWFLADKKALQDFFKKEFKESALPKSKEIESLDKDKIYQALASASKDTSKGKYSKGAHSFEILSMLDPQKVSDASPWAKRFLDELRSRMGVSLA
jgi:hypothetical protein